MKILVVDDEPQLRNMLGQILRQHSVVTAENGAEGIRQFEDALRSGEPFQLVLTDFSMPEKNGMDVLAAVLDSGADVPVVILTANQELAERPQDFGFRAGFKKPYSPLAVRHFVDRLT